MYQLRSPLSPRRLALLLLALALILTSWLGVAQMRAGLVVRSLQQDHVPLLYLAPRAAQSLPGVLVAHGYTGSKQLMLGYGYTLAQAGYAVMLWDFNGHGANPVPLQRGDLQPNLTAALVALLNQPEVDPTRLAVIGHSMGSGVAMNAALAERDRFTATVAISPTGAAVTPDTPRNLQLQAGSWEPNFLNNAQRLLEAAGGTQTNLAAGRGRELVVIPNVEHITILLSANSQQAALNWLDQSFGLPPGHHAVDRRFLWYGLHLLGWLLFLIAIAPVLTHPSSVHRATHPVRRWGGLFGSAAGAGGGLLLLNPIVDLQSLGGIQVGGAIALWFWVAGVLWLAAIGQIPRPTGRDLGLGLGLFGILWLGFGAIAQFTWLQWWLIPARLGVWAIMAIACLPWFLASGIVLQNLSTGKRLLWWLAQGIALIGGFLLLLYAVPQLGFMFILLPLFPPLLAILSVVAYALNQSWGYAVGSALFFAWILAAVFPLTG